MLSRGRMTCRQIVSKWTGNWMKELCKTHCILFYEYIIGSSLYSYCRGRAPVMHFNSVFLIWSMVILKIISQFPFNKQNLIIWLHSVVTLKQQQLRTGICILQRWHKKDKDFTTWILMHWVLISNPVRTCIALPVLTRGRIRPSQVGHGWRTHTSRSNYLAKPGSLDIGAVAIMSLGGPSTSFYPRS